MIEKKEEKSSLTSLKYVRNKKMIKIKGEQFIEILFKKEKSR